MILAKHAHYVNLLNIAALAGMSYWQIDDFNKFPLVIFPLFLGLIMLPMNNSIRDKNKQIIRVATVITILAAISLIYPSIQIYSKGDEMDYFRISVMIFTTTLSLIALISCVKKTRNNLI